MWWCTRASRVSEIAAMNSPDRLPSTEIHLEPPVSARESTTWQRYALSMEYPTLFHMSHSAGAKGRRAVGAGDRVYESASISTESEGKRVGYRLTEGAHLVLRVELPVGYPVGPARSRVRLQSRPSQEDALEEERLKLLAGDASRCDGLHRFGSVFLLSVPQPLLNRVYEIEWVLPTTAQRASWIASERRRLAR
jgi:hypothetical protein